MSQDRPVPPEAPSTQAQEPGAVANKEAIPEEQPLAASPGPQVRHEPKSGWRSGWTYLLIGLCLLVVLGALHRYGTL
jgi:hypothetical protein